MTQPKSRAGSAKRAKVARDLLANARQANARIGAGLDAVDDPDALEAFRLANRTIAEHVHSQDIYDRLRILGVEYVQGELIGVPIPIEALFAAALASETLAERA